MDLETLDRIHRQNNEMILRRAGMAGVKAVSFGSESLDDLVSRIADAYGLDAVDRERLYPFRAASAGDDAVPAAASAPPLLQAGRALLHTGVAAAKTAARGRARAAVAGRLGQAVGGAAAGAGGKAGRAVPWLAAALGIYGASTAGWFWMRARKYNQDCYDLLRTRIEAASAAPPPAPKPAPRKRAPAKKSAPKPKS